MCVVFKEEEALEGKMLQILIKPIAGKIFWRFPQLGKPLYFCAKAVMKNEF